MTSTHDPGRVASSFRDPSGFLFERNGVLLRQVNSGYEEHYRMLLASGLYEELVAAGLLVRHEETDEEPSLPSAGSRVIRPERLPFISYPYEWCFGQFKAAALATLQIQQRAFAKGMVLKDASAYNIQFHRGKPVLIDTLSFAAYREGEPWQAYRQFCQHFLAPLALMARKDARCGLMSRQFIDGIPLDLASRLLGWRSRLSPRLLLHIHLHARLQKRHEQDGPPRPGTARTLGRAAFLGILDSLTAAVQGLVWRAKETPWGDYYRATNYSADAFAHKRHLVAEFLAEANPGTVWDLGANEGEFSRLAATAGRFTVAFDLDPLAVERNWCQVQRGQEENLLPLLMDLTNPSPMLGWANSERDSLAERGPVDCVMALALVHHLAIANNVPLPQVAGFLAALGESLIIEFVPKGDSQVQRLLGAREDVFPDYDEAGFEQAFGQRFAIARKEPIRDSSRVLYLMKPR